MISIHAPLAGSDTAEQASASLRQNFNPRSPRGERPPQTGGQSVIHYFNPRSPRGERLSIITSGYCSLIFQSTLPSRGATLEAIKYADTVIISIHAPLAGSDNSADSQRASPENFNPRSPRGERQLVPVSKMRSVEFQSTLPSRGATIVALGLMSTALFQSTLPSRGATFAHSCHTSCDMSFQSTLPSRGATHWCISRYDPDSHFNPRSPRGERQSPLLRIFSDFLFQSTLPSRGATGWQLDGLDEY